MFSGKKCTVVGAGPVGLTTALYMKKLGYDVVIYDSLDDIRKKPKEVLLKRNLAFAVAERGVAALEKFPKVLESVTSKSVRITTVKLGSMKIKPPADKRVYMVQRAVLQTSLVEECENQGITIFFNSPCIGLDTRRNSVSFLQAGSHMITIQSDLILGCDGVHSAVREHLSRQIAISVTKETSPHCYRYVDVPYIKGVIEESALQVFFVDSGKFFMTYPKGNGEYGGVIYFSKYFAESLTSNEKVQTWLKDSFPLFYDHIKDQFKGDSLDHAYLKFVKCLSISKTRSR